MDSERTPAKKDRGPYFTRNLALAIERRIAYLEGRWEERFDEVSRRLDAQNRTNELLRRALLATVETRGGKHENDPPETPGARR